MGHIIKFSKKNLFWINQNFLINENYQDNPNQLNGSKINYFYQMIKYSFSRYNKNSTIKINKLFLYKYYFFSTFLKKLWNIQL